jgi:hypothetical protein
VNSKNIIVLLYLGANVFMDIVYVTEHPLDAYNIYTTILPSSLCSLLSIIVGQLTLTVYIFLASFDASAFTALL